MLGDNGRGAAVMVMSMAAFTINDTMMKVAGASVPLFQAIFMRGVLTSLILIGLVFWMSQWPQSLSAADRRLILWRSAMDVIAAYFFLTALFNMPISTATAIIQVLPLCVTLAGAVILHEPVGWRRWAAIVVGFLGTLLIIQPGTEGFTIYALYAVAAVVAVTARDIIVRQLSPSVPSVFVAACNSVAVCVAFGLATLTQSWVFVVPGDLFLLVGAAVTVVVAYTCSVLAMRMGEISFVTPFRYSGILIAILLGVLIFGERPNALALIGTAIVVGSGLYTLYREARQQA